MLGVELEKQNHLIITERFSGSPIANEIIIIQNIRNIAARDFT
jgi:hypothetical protein